MSELFRYPLRSRPEGRKKHVKRIVVRGAAPQAGCSFICGLLASAGSDAAVIETARPYFYEAMGMEKRFAAGFCDCFARLRAKQRIPDAANEDEGINWIARRPEDAAPLSASELFRLFAFGGGRVSIFDCSGLGEDISMDLMADADACAVVIDPMPTKLFAAADFLGRVRASLPDAVLIVNKMNGGVHEKELSRFLGTSGYFSVPSVPYDLMYRAEYDCQLPSRLPQAAGILGKTQDMLIKMFY